MAFMNNMRDRMDSSHPAAHRIRQQRGKRMTANIKDTQRWLYTYKRERDSDEELQRFVYQTALKIRTMSI